MSHFLFILLLLLVAMIRTPLALLLIVLKNFNQTLKKRFLFERKNFIESECRSFKKDNVIADYCFEISSEGELEQVRPVIEYLLNEKKRLEILFSSPSVESKCLKMARDNNDQLRVFRLPLVTHNFFFQTAQKWMSAPKLIFCRYDFFPELLIIKFFRKKFILLSAAAKNPTWFKKEVYRLFDLIVAANASEARAFKLNFGLDPKKLIFDFDFRIPRISKRIQKSHETLRSHNELNEYLSFLEKLPASRKLVIGSAWISDLAILHENAFLKQLQSGEFHLLVVPHDLQANSVNEMMAYLKNLLGDIPLYEISPLKSEFNSQVPGVVLLNKSGVLCEMYTHFKSVYVGGGFARSIHSVLEPYLAGAQVFCGPKIHRSTEYDFILEASPSEIHLLKNPESFYHLFMRHFNTRPDQLTRDLILEEAETKMVSIIQEIKAC